MPRRRRDCDDGDELDAGSKALKWLVAVAVGGVIAGLTHVGVSRVKDRSEKAITSSTSPESASAKNAAGSPPAPPGSAPASSGPSSAATDWQGGFQSDVGQPTQAAAANSPAGSAPGVLPISPPPNSPDKPASTGSQNPGSPPAATSDKAIFLTALTPFEYEKGPWDLGIGNTGDSAKSPVKVAEKPSPHGLGMHTPHAGSSCRVSFGLNGHCQRFKGWAALNDYHADSWSPVIFTVYGDGKALWQSTEVNRKSGPCGFNIDVTGVKVLTLETKLSKGLNLHAHAVWFEPWLEK